MHHPPELVLLALNKMNKDTLMETLQIEFTEVGEDYLIAKMPVSPKVHQPYGLLHGGASIALAESVGSSFSALSIDNEKFKVLGMQMSANHLKSMKEGDVFAKATFLKKGKQTHLVQIILEDQEKNIISICNLTNFIQEKKVY